MEKYFNALTVPMAFIGGLVSSWLGGWDTLLKTIVALVVLDYATGILKSIYMKQLSSTVCFKGIVKKITIFVVICTAYTIQRLIGESIPIREIVIMFFIGNEGISIVENSSVIMPIPDRLKELFIQIKNTSEDKKDE